MITDGRFCRGYCRVNYEFLPRFALVRIWSAVLVHTKGWQRSFQPSMNAVMASISSRTEPKVPRRID